MTEIHTFQCDRDSREAFINHAWETQERSLLESRQRTLLPWAFVLFIKRTALSRPRWTTGRMGQTGQTPVPPPVSFWCHLNLLADCLYSLGLLSLPIWLTVSVSQATVSTISATVSANGLSLQSWQTLSALWNCILADSHPSIRAALSLYLSAFPYLSKGRKLTKKILVKSALADVCTRKGARCICIYTVSKNIYLYFSSSGDNKRYFINAFSNLYSVLCFVFECYSFYTKRCRFYENFRVLHRNSNFTAFQ